MKFYNTMTKTKEEFTPINGNDVKMYTCGPTVYNYFHIGNARCFVLFDMLRRYMEYRGYNVKYVQNFTDIDDKMINKANQENTTVSAIAEEYINEYFTDAKGLGIQSATVHPKATENIDEIIKIVTTLIERGFAYEVNGDVYFCTKKYSEYGKLSHMPIDELEAGARVDVTEQKQDPLDFALWKSAKINEPEWDSPWGKGRPGWHIECSAMAIKYLGESIDIHCGGQDLSFPHHENEIAQSEAATGKNFSNYWLHNGYINVDNKKMSKSLNNFFTVRDISEKYGYGPIRFFVMSSHYRSPINFSTEIIEQSKSALERIYNCEDNIKFYLDTTPESSIKESEINHECEINLLKIAFIHAMDDDFNTADGISKIFDLVRNINMLINGENKPSTELINYAYSILNELISLMGFKRTFSSNEIFEAKIKELIEKRTLAKKAKKFDEADKIRADLLAQGIILEDTPQGTKFKAKP